ncbi:MAG: D-alanyl-D-alanine carboxypeptidase [Proteobacteria bacterium]|nr:D-alanyl-D-alanine carboxypeptidase [Pseudomonadota bacterium]
MTKHIDYDCSGRPTGRLAGAVFAAFLGGLISATSVTAADMETSAREAILIDAQTGTVLLAKNADQPTPPASMSKLMTLYMLFERLKGGGVSLDNMFRVSENAWRKGGAKSGGSTMFLDPNSQVKVEELIRGIIIQSGNDACIVVAENLAGSEEAFARKMTEKARTLGMTNSTFTNSTGWPDPDHRMTAHDLATLALRTIKDFPEFYGYFNEREYTHNGIRQTNRNPLLYNYPSADGLKTGHTEEAGYGLTASAVQDGRRLILVVNGLATRKSRASEPARILDWGFREFGTYSLFKAGDVVETAPVWLGKAATVPLIIDRDVQLTMKRKSRQGMKVIVRYNSPVSAPMTAGQQVGTVSIEAPDFQTVEAPLKVASGVERLGLISRLQAAIQFILWGENG